MTHSKAHHICIVDDETSIGTALREDLEMQGYTVSCYDSAEAFLAALPALIDCSLIISDINMPGLSGFDLCKTVRSQKERGHIPIILITGREENSKTKGLQTGADELISKPFSLAELNAKVESLLKIRETEVSLNERLDSTSRHLHQMQQFVSPNVVNLVTKEAQEKILKPHRARIVVLFADLRGFTTFSEKFEPEEVMEVLGQYYKAVGNAAIKHRGTLGHLAGDGIMVFFNDPEPIDNPMAVALQAALEAREALAVHKKQWRERNYNIDFGIGVSEGYATIGSIGFEHFSQYSAIGSVTNFAARLCQVAQDGQILVSSRFLSRLERCQYEAESIGDLQLKGIERLVQANNVLSLKAI